MYVDCGCFKSFNSTRTNVVADFVLFATTFLFRKAVASLTPSLLLSAKSQAALSLFACKRAHNASACYQLFAGAPAAQRDLSKSYIPFRPWVAPYKVYPFFFFQKFGYNIIKQLFKERGW